MSAGPRRGRRSVQLDARTNTMSTTALMCRSIGHATTLVPTAPKVRREFLALGQRLMRLKCSRGCSYWRELILDANTGELIGARSGYDNPEEYLVQTPGSGRLPRAAARVAFLEHL